MSKHLMLAAVALLIGAASVAQAQVVVDGKLDSAYGAAKSQVLYDPTAPNSNFGSPGPTTSGEAYSIYLTSDANDVYGFIKADGIGTPAGQFSNLYLDLDPATTMAPISD